MPISPILAWIAKALAKAILRRIIATGFANLADGRT
jgi:hypothetical protein